VIKVLLAWSGALFFFGGMTFEFTIAGGSNGVSYDVFATTNLNNNMVWTWLGQGTNDGVYTVTNQTAGQSFFMLSTDYDSYGVPLSWYVMEGLYSLMPGLATQDTGQDGLVNWQKYLYGANPQSSLGFGVWVGQPNGTSAIP
jgi:hypothetical protein